MPSPTRVLVALSGGVDSAVAAWLLTRQGFAVECLHMSNWDDDDGHCSAAEDLRDAQSVCEQIGVTLHRVSFSREYQDRVFTAFLREISEGQTPNPDVLCNREIKFGVLVQYARRLGAERLATGHYARIDRSTGQTLLLKATDAAKDQSYFLHAVAASQLTNVMFPLGQITKDEVRNLAREAGLKVAGKRDSTGICFIGERPYGEFLSGFIAAQPGAIVTIGGTVVGQHDGLHLYTLGQRKGLGIGGIESAGDEPWYVAEKRGETNELVVVQGHDNPALLSDWLESESPHWIGPPPPEWHRDSSFRCHVKTRYRQSDQPCEVTPIGSSGCRIVFDRAQRSVTPGQYAVFYLGDRCLGGARIARTGRSEPMAQATAEAS